MKAKKTIIWFIEHVARELDVACAIKILLEKKFGIQVVIKHKFSELSKLADINPDVIVLPHAYNASTDAQLPEILQQWPEAKYFNMAWEQIYYGLKRKIKSPRGEWVKKRVYHNAWGEFYKKYLVHHGVVSDNVFVNGHPVFDLYNEPYCGVYPGREKIAKQYGLTKYKKWIFFPENYGWGFQQQYSLEKIAKRHDVALEILLEMKEFCLQSFDDVLNWAQRFMLKKNDEYEFILRPRPATSLAACRGYVESVLGSVIPGMHIINNLSVREWILSADIISSSFSTSLLEAVVAGKPAFMTKPLPFPLSLDDEWYCNMPCATNVEEFSLMCTAEKISNVDSLGWINKTFANQGSVLLRIAKNIAAIAKFPKSLYVSVDKGDESVRKHTIEEAAPDFFTEEEVVSRCLKLKKHIEKCFGDPCPMNSMQSLSSREKYERVKKVAEQFKEYDIFIETGTYKGGMVEFVKGMFNRVYSIELDDVLYQNAEKRFQADRHVTILHGDSGVMLGILLQDIDRPCIFWLDGHYSGGNTACSEKQTPICEELQHIFLHQCKKHIILIDDIRCFRETKKDYPLVNDIKNMVYEHLPNSHIEIVDDIMCIFPTVF